MSDIAVDSERGDSRSTRWWRMFGNEVPRDEIVFFVQVVMCYIIIITSIVNLSTKNGDSNLWTALLGSATGYLLPSPTMQRIKDPASR